MSNSGTGEIVPPFSFCICQGLFNKENEKNGALISPVPHFSLVSKPNHKTLKNRFVQSVSLYNIESKYNDVEALHREGIPRSVEQYRHMTVFWVSVRYKKPSVATPKGQQYAVRSEVLC